MSSARKPTTTYQSLAPLILAETAHEQIEWVKGAETDGFVFRAAPITIDADIETVWNVVKDVNQYETLSGGVYAAEVDGEVEVGKTIGLDVTSAHCVGIPHSDETITAVDEQHKIIGWERHLSLHARTTERYQVLEALADQQTKSYLAVRIPGFAGFFSRVLYQKSIESAFNALQQGIKQEAEQRLNK